MKRQEKIKILAALSLVGDPYDSKRIKMFLEAGFEVEAVAFERKYHKGRRLECPVTVVGAIEHGNYMKRLLKIISALPLVRSSIRKNDLVYASGLDMAFMAYIAGMGMKKPLIIGIADIRNIQVTTGFLGILVRWLDKQIVDRSKLLITTASGFIDGYYSKWLKVKTSFIVIENKLEKDSVFPTPVLPISNSLNRFGKRPLRIGYFGVLRCQWSLKVLLELAKAKPEEVEVVIAGIPLINENLLKEADKFNNVTYLGTYKSPEGLPQLYNKVDLVWACYPGPGFENENWKWAQMVCRSNRFYESCFFGKPIISLAGSGDGIEVEKYKIGKIICDQGIESVIKEIGKISSRDIELWKNNIMVLPEKVYLYTSEVQELNSAVRDILKKD